MSLRYFNVFGPRQDPVERLFGRAVALHDGHSATARRPPSSATARQSRDFTYVEDVVALNLKAAQAPAESFPGTCLQRRQRRADHAESGLGAAAEDRRRDDSGALRTAARGRCARFAGRYDTGGARPRSRSAVHLRAGHARDARLVSRFTHGINVKNETGVTAQAGKRCGLQVRRYPDILQTPFRVELGGQAKPLHVTLIHPWRSRWLPLLKESPCKPEFD